MRTSRRITSIPAVRAHYRKARKAEKCAQCMSPWHDGTCSCGQWGPEEDSIVELILAEEIKRSDANLKPVKELQGLWKR